MIEHPSIIDTIRSTIDEQSASLSPEATAALTAALIEREDGIVEHLRLVGERFGLMPVILAKAMTVFGLGSQPSEEGLALINAQYDALFQQMKDATLAQYEAVKALGIPVHEPNLTDPMLVEAVEIPDTLPEA